MPRLFSMMIDLIILSSIVPFITKLIANNLILRLFQNYFLSEEKVALRPHSDISQIISDPTMYVNLNRILLFTLIVFIINLILIGIYFVFFWQKYNATPGKILMKMKIVNADDFTTPSMYNLIKRFIGYSTILIGMWSVLTNKRNMALHDKIANTVVIKS